MKKNTPWLTFVALHLLFGCRSRAEILPFPKLVPMPPAAQLATVRSRVDAIRTISARVQVAIDSPRLSGSFDLITVFERPGRLRLSAFKNVLFSNQQLFDLTFDAQKYHLVIDDEEGREESSSGTLADFPSNHADMADLFWLREVLFLPGEIATQEALPTAVAGDDQVLFFSGKTGDGATIGYFLDAGTLAVLSATLTPPAGESINIRYGDYRLIGAAFIPHRVVVQKIEGQFSMESVVLELDVNRPVDANAFEVATRR